MTTQLLQPDAVVLEGRTLNGAIVEISDGLVVDVTVDGASLFASPNASPPGLSSPDPRIQRVSGTLIPGLVDLQVNGAGGHNVDEANDVSLDSVAAAMLEHGAAAFLPTLISQPFETLLEQVRAVARWMESWSGHGAEPLGLHVEGPFLRRAGAHDETTLIDPTPARVEALLQAGAGRIALVTLAPSRDGAAAATAQLTAAGVSVSLGHDAGAAAIAGLGPCIEAGATMATHLFNAMGGGDHRTPGFAAMVMDRAELSCGLILDRIHVHEVLVRQAVACVGIDRILLTTDCIGAMGMPDGTYKLAEEDVTLRDGEVRNAAGVLAGSAISPIDAAAGFLEMVPAAGPESLARVGSLNPSRLIGNDRYGCIAPGRVARFLVLEDDGTLASLTC